jgi:cell surface protein SprA
MEMDIRWDIAKQSGSFIAGLLAAYSGSDASGVSLDFPIPNWAVKYSGLMRYGLFKRNFKGSLCSIIIDTQSINIDLILIMIKPLMELMLVGTFNKTIMSNVNLVEQFSPLIRMDFELKSSLKVLTEIKKKTGRCP